MARKPREMVITLTLTPAQYKLVKERADENWLDPAAWVLMMLKRMSEGRSPEIERRNNEAFAESLVWPQPDAPELPPLPESELDAIVDDKLAEVATADPVGQSIMGPSTIRTAEVRPLHRPPVPFSPHTQPHHLKGLA